MGLFETAAAKALASSGVFLFMTVLLIAAAKRISTCIALFSVQSLVITAQIIAVSRMHHSAEGFVIAGLVLTVKVVAIPYALYRIVEELKAPRDVSSSTSSSQSVFIAAGLILLSFFAVRPYVGVLGGDQAMLAAAVALVLTGGFLMVSRKKALMQVVGLLVLDNGIFLAALTTTFGMPLIIEIGIVFDLLMGVFLMGLFVFRIRDTFDHLDVSKLRRLRG
jgi:hydrogenase-4 component E